VTGGAWLWGNKHGYPPWLFIGNVNHTQNVSSYAGQINTIYYVCLK